jgi:hypothetical protein
MIQVIATDEFVAWYDGLADVDVDAVNRAVLRLEQEGVALGFPHSSAIMGWNHAIRELRVQSQGRPLRLFYAFDTERNAVVIIGGDKTGDDRFYERMQGPTEAIWTRYLEERKKELEAAKPARGKQGKKS